MDLFGNWMMILLWLASCNVNPQKWMLPEWDFCMIYKYRQVDISAGLPSPVTTVVLLHQLAVCQPHACTTDDEMTPIVHPASGWSEAALAAVVTTFIYFGRQTNKWLVASSHHLPTQHGSAL
jgi:hypothetical protein